MGYGHKYTCKNCGKEGEMFLDVGKQYPSVCADAKESALSGKFGKRVQKIVQDNPNGIFDCTNVLYKCKCGGWRVDEKMQYCLPKKPISPKEEYYNEWNNRNSTILWKRRHPCPKCRKNMIQFTGNVHTLRCPDCGGKLEVLEGYILWD